MCHWLPLIHDREPSVACTAAGEFWILNLWWVLTGWRWITERPTLQKNWVARVHAAHAPTGIPFIFTYLHITLGDARRPAIHAGSVLWRLVLVERQHRNLWSPPSCNILQPQGSSQSSQWLHNLRPYWLPLGIEHNETRKQNQADLALFTSCSPGCCRTWKDILERFAKKWRAPILTTNLKWTVWVKHDQTWSNMGFRSTKLSFSFLSPVFLLLINMCLWHVMTPEFEFWAFVPSSKLRQLHGFLSLSSAHQHGGSHGVALVTLVSLVSRPGNLVSNSLSKMSEYESVTVWLWE